MSDQMAEFRADRDAFGHMLLDHLNGQQAVEIIEREDGFIFASMECKRYFSEYQDWEHVEQEAMRWLVPGRLLDLGCGAGRVALYLQDHGHEVVGIDVSPLAIDVCRRRGLKDARLLSITQVGRELGVFDTILMMGNNWGLMANRKRARWLLRRFYAMTSPGARIIAASNDIYQTESSYHLAYHAYNRERGRMAGQIRMRVRYLVYRSDRSDYLMVSRDEMQSILEGTGWHVVKFLDSSGPAYAGILEKERAR
jgi:cyclopropane fatty-acyl-phospholipid synthase-like methyltransferase